MLKKVPKEIGLKDHSTAVGFAELVGCSSSWIRNVECRATKNWASLARRIESVVGVSAKWLLSDPPIDEPILDSIGKVWDPVKYLDPLSAHEGMPDWRKLYNEAASAIPYIMAEDLKATLIWDLSLGLKDSMASTISFFKELKIYKSPALEGRREKNEEIIGKMSSKNFYHKFDRKKLDAKDLEKRFELNLARISVDEAAMILEEEGAGWVFRLSPIPDSGPINEMLKFHNYSIEKL